MSITTYMVIVLILGPMLLGLADLAKLLPHRRDPAAPSDD